MSGPRVTVRLDPALHQDLTALARSTRRSVSDVLREALQRHVKRRGAEGNCYELARRAGIIGVVKGLPRDLSTRRAHFEGVGSDS